MRREILATTAVLAAAALILCGCGNDESAGTVKAQEENTAKDDAEPEQTSDETAPESIEQTGSETELEGGTVQLAGTTFSVMGDSISTYRGYNPEGYYVFFPENGDVADVKDTWWQQAADELELTLFVNGSSSGATVTGDSTGTEDPQCACNEFRTGALAGPENACPDRIIVYLGANDMLQTVPLGDNDGTRPVEEGQIAAFSDAYTLMLDKLQTKYPLAKIYCCTLHQMGNYGTQTPYVEFVNGIGLTAKDYGKVIAGIAESRGFPVIDLYDCGITVENLQEMSSDGIHPTAAGMHCIAGAVEEALSCR